MLKTRRRFLVTLAAAASCCVAMATPVPGQKKRNPFPTPPEPAENQNPADAQSTKATSDSAKRAAMQQNEKEFRAEVDRLYQLVVELKREVDGTPTADIFSVKMFKRTEEIEKVVKQLKARAKG
jgi:uncharacterized protein with WD repeat